MKKTYIALHGDELEPAVVSLMVQLRLPVVALVQKFIAGGSLGIASLLVGLCLLEVGTASNDMNVGRDLSGEDNGIASLNSQWRAVDCKQTTSLPGTDRHGRHDGGR